MIKKLISFSLVISLLGGNFGSFFIQTASAQSSSAVSPGGVSNNLHFWVKAEDASMQGDLLKLPDRSNNGFNMISETADRTPRISEKDNIKSIVFDGSNDVLVSEQQAKIWGENPNFTAFYVGWTKTNHTTQTILAHGETRNISDGLYLAMHPTGAFIAAEDKNFFFQHINRNTSHSIVKWTNESRKNATISLNGKAPLSQVVFEAHNTTGDDKKILIGNLATNSAGFWPYSGDYNELIVFNGQLSADESQKVLTYLACKYSQPLDQTSPNKYVNSNGDILWNPADNTTHNVTPICLLRDDNSGVNKAVTFNRFDNKDISISSNTLENNSSLVWSNNGAAFEVIDTGINSNYWRIKREWRVSETLSDTGELTITIPYASFPNIRKDKKLFLAINNGSADFTAGSTRFVEGVANTNTQEFTFKANLNDADYFTFAFEREAGPGGVSKTSLTSWFKADSKFEKQGGKTTWWSDTIYEIDASDNSGNGPIVSPEKINFEDQLKFSIGNRLVTHALKTDGFLNIPTLSSGKAYGSVFVVYKTENPILGALVRQAQTNELYSLRLSGTELEYKAREGAILKTFNSPKKHNIYSSIFDTPAGSDVATVTNYLNGTEQSKGTLENNKYIYEQTAPVFLGPSYDGQVAEIITYNTTLTPQERQQVETYLACKYGLSLAQWNAGRNYLNAQGQTIWDFSENVGYNNNVACIIRDDIADLNKTVSQSQETLNGNIIVRSANLNTDGSALLWSDNGGKVDQWTLTNAPDGKKISKKIIRFSEKNGDVGDIDVLINKSDLAYFNGTIQLAVKNDTDFKNGAYLHDASEEWDKYKFTLNPQDGDYIAIVLNPAQLAEPALWFKASDVKTTADNKVKTWTGAHGFEFAPTGEKPTKVEKAINNNPVISFENSPLKGKVPYIFDTSRQYELFTVILDKNGESSGTIFSQVDGAKANPSIDTQLVVKVSDENTTQQVASAGKTPIKAEVNHAHYVYDESKNISYLDTRKNTTLVNKASESITPLQSSQIKQTLIGGDGTTPLKGNLAEIVGFNKTLSDEEREKVVSYLSIKYGITPESGNLTLSNGSKIYERDNDYKYNIAAVAKDDAFSLNQTISKNIYDAKDITLEKVGINNGQGVSISSNNEEYIWTGVKMPLGYYGYKKSWKVQHGVDVVDNVNIYVDNASLTTGFGGTLQMYISDTNDFTNAKIVQAVLDESSNTWKFSNVELGDNKFFTLGYYSNVPPTDILINDAYVAEIAENSPLGTEVATIKGIDGNNDPLSYSFACAKPGADDASFTIDGDKLKVNGNFDFETKKVYNICIRTTDIVGSHFDKNLTVNITNVNEAPTDISLTTINVTENNRVGVNISDIKTVDGDSDKFTYTLVAGEGSDDNSSFSITNDKLIISVATDFETKESYKIRIRSTDDWTLFFEKAFVINVLNVDDSAPNINVTQGVYLGPASSNVVKFKVQDVENSGLAEVSYAYSANNICSDGDTYTKLNINQPYGENEYSIPHDDESKNNQYFCIYTADNAGNKKYYVSDNKFYIRTTPPYQPVITGPDQNNDGITNTKQPAITGTIERGTNIIIKKNDNIICQSTNPSTDENFSCQLTEDLEEGLNSIMAYSCDTAVPTPNCSGEKPFIVTVDTIKPVAPTFVSPLNDSHHRTVGTAVVKAERGAKVEVIVYKGNQELAQNNAKADDTSGEATIPLGVTFRPDASDYKIKARTIDKAGNVGEYAEVVFTIDTVAPANPTVKTPAANTTINKKQPTIEGENAEPRSKIVLTYTNKDSVVKNLETTVLDNGTWSIPLTEDLKEGNNTISVYQKDLAGNQSQNIDHTFKIDTIPPEMPIVKGPNDYLNTRTFTLIGEGSANDKIEIMWNGEKTETPILTNKSWKYTFTANDDGVQNFEIRSFDENGNYTEVVNHSFHIDTQKPEAPRFVNPNSDIKSNDKTPTFILSGEKNLKSYIKILKGSDEVTTITVDSGDDGSIMGTSNVELTNGVYTIQAYQIDKALNQGLVSSMQYEVDTDAPDRPTILFPKNLSILNSGTFVLRGTGEENGRVFITVGLKTFEGDVESDGNFSVRIDGLTDETYLTSLYIQDQQGNRGESARVTFTIDTTAPENAEITSDLLVSSKQPILKGTAEKQSKIIVNGNTTCYTSERGEFTCPQLVDTLIEGPNNVVIQTCDQATPSPNCKTQTIIVTVDTTPPALPTITAPAVNSVLNTVRPEFVGTATDFGVKVKVVVGSNTFEGNVSPTGEINIPSTEDLPQGPNEASITLLDALGNETAPIKVKFYVDTEAPEAPTITSPTPPVHTQADSFTIKGKAEPEATVIVEFNGKKHEKKAEATGDYTIQFSDSSLLEETYTLKVNQKDMGGNLSPETTLDITIDRTAPALPTITSHKNGEVVTKTTITLEGDASEKEGKFVVEIGGERLETPLKDRKFSLELPGKLKENNNSITYWQEDIAGNYSNPKGSYSIIVDTLPPQDVFIEAPTEGEYVNTKTPTIKFLGEALGKYTIKIGELEYNGSINNNGDPVSFVLPDKLEEGAKTIEITIADKFGNINPNKATRNFIVDTERPNKVAITSPQNAYYQGNFVLEGTGELGAEIIVKKDTQEIGRQVVTSTGDFDIPVNDMPEGTHTIKVQQKDRSNNLSEEQTYTFTIDKTIPNVVNITVPEYSKDNTVNFEVTLNEDGHVVYTISDDTPTIHVTDTEVETIAQKATFTQDLQPNKTYTITAWGKDKAGNLSAKSSKTFVLDNTPPAPVDVKSPVNGTESRFAAVDISFIAEDNAVIEVYVNNELKKTISDYTTGLYNANGLDLGLKQGNNLIQFKQKDKAGNVSNPVDINYSIDTEAPEAPKIPNIVDGQAYSNALDNIELTGEPHSKYYVTFNSQVFEGTVEASGKVVIPITGVTEGPYRIVASLTDKAQNKSQDTIVNFTVDTTPPTQPALTVKPLYNKKTLTGITGTAEAHSKIQVLNKANVSICSTTADNLGEFSCDFGNLEEWANELTITSCDKALPTPNCSQGNAVINVDTVAPKAPVITSPAENSIFSIKNINFNFTSQDKNGVKYKVTRSGSSDIKEGDIPASGEVREVLTLDEGTYTIKVVLSDEAGNTSETTTTFRVKTTPPAAPTITSPKQPKGYVTSGDFYIKGKADKASKVKIFAKENDKLLSECASNNEGDYSCDVKALKEATMEIYAVACDYAQPINNCSTQTPGKLEIDTTPPAAINILTPANGIALTSPNITISLKGEPYLRYEVVFDGKKYDGVLDDKGEHKKQHTLSNLRAGEVIVNAYDEAGNKTVSKASYTYNGSSASTSPSTPSPVPSTPYTPPVTSTPTTGGATTAGVDAFCNIFGPTTAYNGENVEITYQAFFARNISINQTSVGQLNVNGGKFVTGLQPNSSTPFIITVENAYGKKASCSLTIKTVPKPTETKPTTTTPTNTGTTTTIVNTANSCKYVVIPNNKIVTTDISKNWAKEFIVPLIAARSMTRYEVATNKVLFNTPALRKGIVDNAVNFNPERNLTRAEFLKMLIRAMDCNYVKPATMNHRYADIEKGVWYEEYVTYARQQGWVGNNGATKFEPNRPITRAEVAKIIANAKKLPVKQVANSRFSDVTASSEFKGFIEALAMAQIISGQTVSGKQVFRPSDNISRAEMSKIIYNTFLKGNIIKVSSDISK